MTPKRTQKTALVLVDIRSEYNVGAIFRTADAAGISEVVLTGYSPLPIDRFGRKNTGIQKSSLGAEDSMPWRSEKDAVQVLEKLRTAGYFIVAIEQGKNAKDYKKLRLPKKNIAFVLGSEVNGLSKAVLSLAHVIAEIPMRGKKESLNVSVAAGIALFRLLDI